MYIAMVNRNATYGESHVRPAAPRPFATLVAVVGGLCRIPAGGGATAAYRVRARQRRHCGAVGNHDLAFRVERLRPQVAACHRFYESAGAERGGEAAPAALDR